MEDGPLDLPTLPCLLESLFSDNFLNLIFNSGIFKGEKTDKKYNY